MSEDTMIKVEVDSFGATIADILQWKGESEDAPVAGDEIGWGWPLHRPSGPYAEDDLYVPVPSAYWGDYVGSTYTRANLIALTRDYPDTFVTVGRSSHDGQSLYLRVGQEIPASLHQILTGLTDYPVYDEDEMSRVEQDLQLDDLDTLIMDVSDEDHDDEYLIRCAYWNLIESDALRWEAETATNGVVSAGWLSGEQVRMTDGLDQWDSVAVLIHAEYDEIVAQRALDNA